MWINMISVVGGGIPQDLPLDLHDGPKKDFGGPA